MLKRFRFLRSLGTPTQWDVSDYLRYRDSITESLSSDLQSMTSDERFTLGAQGTFWHALLTRLEMADSSLSLEFKSDSEDRRFRFEYSGVMRVRSDLSDQRFMPTMVVQELVRTRGAYRHSISALGGESVVVVCQSMRFFESLVH